MDYIKLPSYLENKNEISFLIDIQFLQSKIVVIQLFKIEIPY